MKRPTRSSRRSQWDDEDDYEERDRRSDAPARSRREREREQPVRRSVPPAEFAPRGRDRKSQSEGSSAAVWVGVVGGSIGLLGLILGLIFYTNADKPEDKTPAANPETIAQAPQPNPEANAADEQHPAPFQQLAANVLGNDPAPAAPAVVNDGNPAPVLEPGPDGVIPAPPAPGKPVVVANNEDKLKYGLKTQQEFAYRTTVKAVVGNETQETRGMTTYQVLGRDPELDRLLKDEAGEEGMATGTGFVVHPDGYLMTCAHVVEGGTRIEVELGGQTYAARVVEMNNQRDLALIQISARNLPVLPLGDANQVELAQHVRVVGFPLSDVLGTSVKITQGSVAGFIDRKNGRLIQVDASMNPGNSGGPLVNNRGEAIGVASAGYFGSEISEVGLAVPASDVVALMRKNSIAPVPSQSRTELDGPDLARKVTPSVAYLKVTINSTPKEAVALSQFSTFSTDTRTRDGRPILGQMPSFPKSDRGKMLVSEFGEILHADKHESSLPFGLGPLAHLAIEPLSADGEAAWGTTRMTTLAQVRRTESRFDPFGGFGGPRSPFSRPRSFPRPRSPFEPESTEVTKVHLALEICEYEIAETTPETQVINKVYSFQTVGDEDPPFFQLTGTGSIRFDRQRLLPDQIRYDLTLQQRTDEGEIVRVPIEVLIERFTDQELADHKARVAEAVKKSQEQAQARANNRATNPPATRPAAPAGDSLDDQLAKIKNPASNFSEKFNALHAVMRITPDDKNRKKVIDVIEPLLKDSNSSIQNTAISAMGKWGTEDRASVLIEMAGSFSQSHRWAAMRALGEIGGKKCAEAVAKRLTDQTDCLTAATALKKMGAAAEDAALEYIDHAEQQVRYQVYNVLGEIGGAKSLAALKRKAENDPNNLNRTAAGFAIRSIEKRQ